MQKSVSEVYNWVVDDVIREIGSVLQQEGIDLSISDELRASWSRKLTETDKKPQQNDQVDLISHEYGTQAQPMQQAAPSRAYPVSHLPRSTQELLHVLNYPPSGPYGVRSVARGTTTTATSMTQQPRVYHFINQTGLHNGMAGFRPQGVSSRIGGGGGGGLKVSPSNGSGAGVFVPGFIQGNNAFHGLQQNHEMLQTRPQLFSNLHLTNSNELQFHTDPALVASNHRQYYQRAGKRKEMSALSQFNNELTTAQSIKAPRLADDASMSRRIPQRDGGNDEGGPSQPSAMLCSQEKELDEDAALSDVDEEEEPSEYKNCLTAQYEKVGRTKNRWRCNLKHGIFSVDGQDYLFKTATGEFTF